MIKAWTAKAVVLSFAFNYHDQSTCAEGRISSSRISTSLYLLRIGSH